MEKKARIALIGDFPLNFENAPGSRYLWLARGLIQRGFEVVVGGVEGGDAGTAEVPVETVRPIRVTGAIGRFLAPHLAAVGLFMRSRLRAADVLWVRGLIVAPLFAVYGRLTGRRVILDFHGLLYREMAADRTSLLRRVMALYVFPLEWLALKLAHGAVSAGEGHQWLLKRYMPERSCWLLPNGIDTARFSGTRDPVRRKALRGAVGLSATGPPVVFFAGRHNTYWDRDAFSALAEKVAPGKVVVIGEGWTGAAPTEVDGVHYLGSRPNEEVADWLASGAEVGLCPYRPDWVNAHTPHYMNSTRKLLEYVGSGLPMVLPDIPALPDYLEAGKHYLSYDPSDREQLAAQVLHLLEHQAEQKKMRAENRKLSARFEWGRLLEDSGVLAWLATDKP